MTTRLSLCLGLEGRSLTFFADGASDILCLRKSTNISRRGAVSNFHSCAGHDHDECKQRKASESLNSLVCMRHMNDLIMNKEVPRPFRVSSFNFCHESINRGTSNQKLWKMNVLNHRSNLF